MRIQKTLVGSASACLTLAAVLLLTSTTSDACTRCVYLGPDDTVITGRTMDWKDEMDTYLWVLPRGIERTGETGENTVSWKAKYGSLIVSSWDIATCDGMNEKGLSANMLWLVDSEYPEWDGTTPGLAVSLWAQYALDNFATVSEAVKGFREAEFTLVTDMIPGTDRLTTVHMSLSDATGDSAILEYIDGELNIHHSRKYQVMTNEPRFEEQLAIASYWNRIGGTVMLPGTNRAADRFARASFYINAVPQTDDRRVATAAVFSVMRNVSVPLGIGTAEQPHISSTLWRIVADHKNLIYHFESAMSPNVFWVEFSKLDFSEGAPARRLDLGPNQTNVFAGETSEEFVEAEPFKFQGVSGPAASADEGEGED
jgi:penicillin V acylase-like amidase (Ntn superfamily)